MMTCSNTARAMRLMLLLGFFSAIGIGIHSASAQNGDAKRTRIEIGTRRQLLVDDEIIEKQVGLKRELGTVEKANDGKPIFTDGRFYGTVLYDDERFKLWYRLPKNDGYGYAESKDGVHFEKRALLSGINFAGDYTLSVMIDPHETDPEHRYKGGYDGPGMAAALAHSRDGIMWVPYNDEKPVTGRAADTYNHLLWDDEAKLYRLFTRTDFGTAGGLTEVRGTRSMTNTDVKSQPTNWELVENWKFEKEGENEISRRQIYAVTDWMYHGIHFALLSVYEWPGDTSEGPADLEKRHERDVMNFYIATSRDGKSWDFNWVYAEQPMIPRGSDGAFDKDLLFPASAIVTHDDRHWLYYCGGNERHGTPEVSFPRGLVIGLARLRLDGFVALTPTDDTATFTTYPFVLEGSELEVNVDASKGHLSVAVQDSAFQEVPGYGHGDCRLEPGVNDVHAQVSWMGNRDLRKLKGQTIRLEFKLYRSKVYAFQILDPK
ncbi:MAG: hypothetical protein ACKVT0_09960 [Planctomycetaceae bacterium]